MTFISELAPLPFCAASQDSIGLCCQFNSGFYRDSLFDEFAIAFPAALQRANTQRKAEFLAGRYLAKMALADLQLTPVEIGIGPQRNPLWPASVEASISHSKNHAVCVMQRTNRTTHSDVAVGLDLEAIIDGASAQQIQSSIISPQEHEMLCNRFIDEQRGHNFAFAFTLLFSAKESLFKALYPTVGRYFDFLDVGLSGIDAAASQLTLQLLTNLSPSLYAGREVQVRWQSHPIGLLTYILP